MTGYHCMSTVEDLKQTLYLVKNQAEDGFRRLDGIRRQSECGKIAFLTSRLDNRRRVIARERGARALAKDKKGLDAIVVETVMVFLGSALFTKEPAEALSSGLGAADRSLQDRGETDWAVSIGDNLAVVPSSGTSLRQMWVEWTSLMAALRLLEERAKNGEAMGDLNKIIASLEETGLLRYVIRLQPIKIRP